MCNSGTFILFVQNKCTPLHIAARDGNEELVEILLEHGASVTELSKVCPEMVVFSLQYTKYLIKLIWPIVVI